MQDSQAITQAATSSSSGQIPLRWVERIFERMAAMYGSVFLDMWAGQDPEFVKQCWAEELEGLTGDEIAAGLAACRERQYPPTVPAFRLMCRQPLDPEVAFHEAARQMALRGTGLDAWSSPAIYWAAVKIGAFDLRNGTWATLKKRWTEALEEMLLDPNLPPVPERVQPLLPEPGRTMVREGGLRAIVGSQVAPSASDKSWAHKLFARYANGERIQEYVIRQAEQALGRSRPVPPAERAA